jgi:hypothetical protein
VREHDNKPHAVRPDEKPAKLSRAYERHQRAVREAEARMQQYQAEQARRAAYNAYYNEMRRRYDSMHRGLLFTDIWNERDGFTR